ncbi:ABC transporter ATP-binding protein [Kineothrix sedimenti]|uniref:ABC transporter ATP-binding protein n=1 Tax=Kineothrix sedimenti TaxID=3123317 RepID=A0ABZ3EXM7_9FIRM
MLDIFKKFFRFADSQKPKWVKSIIFTLFKSVFASTQLLAIAIVLRGIATDSVTHTTALSALGIMLVSIIGTIVMRHMAQNSQSFGCYIMSGDKRIQIGDRLKLMPMGHFNSHSLGNITAAATSTMEDIENTAPRIIVSYLNGLIHGFVITLALIIFEWKIGLIAMAGLVLFLLINILLHKRARKASQIRQEAQAELVDAVLEYIQGMSVVKSFGMEAAAGQKIHRAIADSERRNIGLEKRTIPFMAMQQLVLRVISTIMITLSVVLYLYGAMDLTICLLMLLSGFIVFSELESGGSMSAFLRLIDASIDRVNEIQKIPVMDLEGIQQKPGNMDIVFKEVSFSYGEKTIIDHVSFAIPAKTTTAIVGPSGSGKTTLCNLIARFWDVGEGSIILGGIDIREYKLDSLLQNISMVFQQVYLFNDTIANNIRLGKPEATKEEIREAAQKACCHDFISRLPDGYDTVIGEGGATLSGGEKQRISIARALLKDAPIIILDEATANVDPENENDLQKAIRSLTRDKTVIMIAHRLKTVRNADQIIVLDAGKIVQTGTHDELFSQKGLYADFIHVREKAVGWKIAGK